MRALRIDMCVYLARGGQSYMNLHLLSLAHALRKVETADEVHLGEELYHVVTKNLSMADE